MFDALATAAPPHNSTAGLDASLAELPLELIEREIEQLAAHISAGSARWLELVGEFDRRDGWGDTGCRSTSEWVAWRCAVTPRAAREQVRVARALRRLPAIGAAFSGGELSYSKVRALTRVADADSEADLLELARHATAAQLERMVRAARRVTAAEAAEAERETFLRWQWNDDDGCLDIHAKLAPEQGALFLEALECARTALRERRRDETEGGSAEPPAPPPPSNAECLSAIGELALARPPSGFNGLVGGERHQVLVHIDAETLAGNRGDCCHLARGPGISPELARRIAGDASLVPLIELDGEPIAIGRARRSIPSSTRRALIARDGCCQFPGCERHRFVDAHHIEHWADGGKTTLGNLILLCRHHHRLVHEFGYTLSSASNGRACFRDPNGLPLVRSPIPPVGDTAGLPNARAMLTAPAAPAAGVPG